MIKLNYHQDSGHGWIEVSRDLLLSLNIGNKISEYSYMSPDFQTYYLEEDFDAGLLLNSLKENNIDFMLNEIYKDGCFITESDLLLFSNKLLKREAKL